MAPGDTSDASQRKVYKTLAGVTSLYVAGESLNEVLVPLVALVVLHASPLQISIILACEQVSWLILGLPAGTIIDRSLAQTILSTALFVRVLLIGSIPFSYALGLLTLAQLIIVSILLGAASVFASVARQALPPKLFERSQLMTVNAKLNALATGVDLGGKAAASGIARLVTYPGALTLDALMSLASAVLLKLRNLNEQPRESLNEPPANDLRQGVNFVLRTPLIRRLVQVTTVVNVSVAMQYSLLFPFLVDSLKVPEGAIGVCIAITGVGGLVGALASTSCISRVGRRRAWRSALLLAALGTVCIPFAWPVAGISLFVIASVVQGAALAIANIIGYSVRQEATPREFQGRVAATSTVISWGLIPVALIIGGAIGSATSPRLGLFAGAVCLAAGVGIGFRAVSD